MWETVAVAAQLLPSGVITVVEIVGGTIAVAKAVRTALAKKKDWDAVDGYNREIFLDRKELSQAVIGFRYGMAPSPMDTFAWSNAFVHPVVAAFRKTLRTRLRKLPIALDTGKHPLFVGGWRPLLPVEPLLRQGRFIFAEFTEQGPVVPDLARLNLIRLNPYERVNWVVFDVVSQQMVGEKPSPGGKSGTWALDLAIITKAESPFGSGKTAVALSGCHGEGTVGVSWVTTNSEPLIELYKEVSKAQCLGKNFQAVVRFIFPPH